MAIAALKDVRFAWPMAPAPVLSDQSWKIGDAELALVVGESGSGKSTLLRCLNGLVPHFSGGRFGGRVLIHGRDTRQTPPRDLARHVGFVFQDPEAQILTDRVDDEIAFGMEQAGLAPVVMRRRVEELMVLLGISEMRHRDPHTLSGGERQRVAIAAALATYPNLLVLDEPTSQLDPWGAEEVIAALLRLNQDLGLSIVVAEHRLERLLQHADAIRIMHRDGTSQTGRTERMLPLIDPIALPPLARLARELGASELPLTPRDARRSAWAVDVSRALQGRQPSGVRRETGENVLELRGVSASYGSRVALKDVSLTLRWGEILGLMGRNGSGKTTLLRTMLGFHAHDKGEMRLHGTTRPAGDAGAWVGKVAYVPQRSSALFYRETLLDELNVTAEQTGAKINPHELLERVDLAWAAERHPSSLSVGERQRAALATVLAGNPRIVLLDEPTRGLDPWHKQQLRSLIESLARDGTSFIVASHDTDLISGMADSVVLLGEGEVIASGAPRDVMSESIAFGTRIHAVFGGPWLTAEDVLSAIKPD